jgi:hypothetical protein
MKSRLPLRNGWMLPLLLATSLMTQACKTISGTDVLTPEIQRLCKDGWKHVKLSHKDTQDTIDQVIANNKARKAFCQESK